MLGTNRHIFFILFVLTSVGARSQQMAGTGAQEKLFIFTDKQSYLAGEVIWYRVYAMRLPGPGPSDRSNAIYAELSNQTGMVLQSKILLARGSCSGAFELPDDLPPGLYGLKIYTSFTKNTSAVSVEEKKIVVLNDQHPAVFRQPDKTESLARSDLNINIRTDKEKYSTREKISLDVSVTDSLWKTAAPGLTISVYKIDSMSGPDRSIAVQVQNAYGSTVSYNIGQPFYGVAEEQYRLDNYTRFNTLEEVFREYIRGVGMGLSSKRHRLFIYDEITRMPFQANAFVILDGAPANDIGRLLQVDPMKIKTINVVTRKYFLGNSIFYGIVDLRSYNGDMAGYEPDDPEVPTSYERIHPQRIFDHPAYTTATQQNSRHPDFRTTLYWQPDVQLSRNGRQQVQFYSSDLKGQFRIDVYRIGPDGSATLASKDFTVN